MSHLNETDEKFDDDLSRKQEADTKAPSPKSLMTPRRKLRLFKSIERSYKEMGYFRRLNRTLVEEYAGPEYLNNDTAPKKYINLMAQAVEAYSMILVGNNPQAWTTSVDPNLRGFSTHFRVALNNLMDEIGMKDTFEEWVRNAFFGMGVIKVHMADSGELIAEDDILMDPGSPFASIVSIDDYVRDKDGRRWSECKYEADMYRVPFDELESMGFDPERIKDLDPNGPMTDTGERLEEMAQEDSPHSDDDFEDSIDLIDVYVKRDGIIYTFAVDDRRTCTLKGDVLMERDWDGHEGGPYKKLCLTKVPEKTLPVPPASYWLPLDRLANNLMRKASRQARRAKEILAYTPSGAEGAKRINSADDGDMVEVQDVNEIQQMKMGGVDAGTNAFMLQVMELFDRMSGNLSAILGLGASSDTVGQEKLIHGANSRMEESMASRVMNASTEVIREIAHLLWLDEFKIIPGEVHIDGHPELRADSTWTPDDREGVFSDYKVQIDIYSMQYQGPGERVSVINQLIQTVYAPLAPLLQQQGGTIDLAALTAKYADMLNQADLTDIITFDQPIVQQQGAGPDGPKKSPVSNRTYTRRNESAGDNSGVPSNPVPAQQEPQT